MRKLVAIPALVLMGSAAFAASKSTQFWNLTANTITSFQLAPAGSQAWGQDQCQNDKDGSVDHDERLKITGVKTGIYDAKLIDNKGRTCIVKSVAIKENAIFSIDEKQLNGCSK
ncbi:MAG: hypothetical protein JO163_09870 [Methylobacteriaceae bacterium]|nr:hypothetical protein [Methylobacteriaceae bacterium]